MNEILSKLPLNELNFFNKSVLQFCLKKKKSYIYTKFAKFLHQ